VVADAADLERVLLNLATNARDAMPFGGILQVRGEAVEMGEVFATAHGLGEPGRYVRIEMRDNGIGMDEATRERMFEPFYSTKPPGRGTGLGLATVFGIVAAHRGHIQVASRPGAGTTIRLYLPLAPPPKPAPRPG
jgi:signal transduction histidine kinase